MKPELFLLGLMDSQLESLRLALHTLPRMSLLYALRCKKYWNTHNGKSKNDGICRNGKIGQFG